MNSMEIRVINEKTGNPFHYFENEDSKKVGFPRTYTKEKNVHTVCEGLNQILAIPVGDYLEIGPGRNPLPTKAYASLAARVSTVSLDWEEQFGEQKKRKTEEDFHPRRVYSREGVEEYLGDVGFLSGEKSELRGREFDLVYLWGSWHNVPYCRSVKKRNYDDRIIIEPERKMKEMGRAVKEGGTLLIISECFSGFIDEECLEGLLELKKEFLRDGLYFGKQLERKAKRLTIIGRSRERTLEVSRAYSDPFWKTKKTFDERVFDEDPVESIIQRVTTKGVIHDYKWLVESWGETLIEAKQTIATLGSIDAIAMHF